MSNKSKLFLNFFIISLVPYIYSFNMEKVTNLSYTFSSSRLTAIFFGASQAPIAPKEDGGYYLCYKSSTSDLCVAEFDDSDELIKNVTLPYKATPFDIIETNNGFAIYAKEATDQNHAFLLIYDSKFNKINETTIMNNGANPTTTKDAIVFKDSNDNYLYGLNAMYNPTNAKLAYGNGRINLIFAHYNYFSDSGGHTGDTYYSFDTKGSKETVKYAWTWLSSHSCIQAHFFDGKYFITAAVGDAYPMGMTITAVDTSSISDDKNYITYKSNQSIIKSFKGNMSGNSLGRLGGIMKFDDFYVIIYSVKKGEGENRDAIFLTKFQFDGTKFTTLETVEIIKGVANKIKNLRAAKYEKQILITYIQNKNDYGTDYPSYYQDMSEKMYYIVCDTDGDIDDGPLEASWHHQALNEDIRPLKDGSLRWGYIDKNNVLRIIKVEGKGISVLLVIFIIFIIIILIAVGVVLFLKYKKKDVYDKLTSKLAEVSKKIPLLNKEKSENK